MHGGHFDSSGFIGPYFSVVIQTDGHGERFLGGAGLFAKFFQACFEVGNELAVFSYRNFGFFYHNFIFLPIDRPYIDLYNEHNRADGDLLKP